ncbi:hypothetical protein [Nocardioides sp. WS12]|uniref:hypothetical protein n=1 Tax=Nocardioides sp. WS12 TaxID=2486272 RepID=UPI0015FE6AA9|nr:hypothetical protein [Nocardioides sp. WS12]
MESLFDRSDVRDLSRRMFGQDHKLSVLLFVARRRDQAFSLGDVSDWIGARNSSSVQKPLKDLYDCGLIADALTAPTDRTRAYVATVSSMWSAAEELYASLEGAEPQLF